MVVRELITKLGFKVDNKKLKKFEKGLQSAKKAAKVTAVVAGAAATSLFLLAKSAAKAGDDIAKTAPTVGLTTDEYQEYRHAVDLAGVSQGKFRSGMRRLSVGIGEASSGFGTAKRTFEALGISVKNGNGEIRSTSDIMLELSGKFKNIKSDAKRALLANDLFGRSGERMANFLTQGGDAINQARKEAHDLGMVLGGKALKDSENFIDQMARATGIFTGIKNSIGVALLPEMSALIEKFKSWFVENKKLVKQKIQKYINLIVKALKILIKIVGVFINVFEKIADHIGGIENLIGVILLVVAAVKAWTIAQWLLNVSMAANPIGAIIVGVGAAIALIIIFRKEIMQLANWFDGLTASAKVFVDVLLVLISPLLGMLAITKTLVGWLHKLGQFFGIFEKITGGGELKIKGGTSNIFGRLQPATAGPAGTGMANVAQGLVRPEARTNNKNTKIVNVNSTITTQVPLGTPEKQKKEIARIAKQAASAEWEKNLRNLSLNNPEVE